MMLAEQDFRSVSDSMAQSVLDACRAQAVHFSFETEQIGRRFVLSYSLEPNDALTDELARFAREKNDLDLAFEPGGVQSYTSAGGKSYIFLLLPLEEGGDTYGSFALAIARQDWVAQGAFAACAQVARLVSMTLSATHTRSRLEHDLAVLNDRTEKLQRQSETDALTGLENKASFEAQARTRLLAPDSFEALVIIDLDFFKEVNDVYGHPFGDSYLQTIARAIQSALPPSALVGRIGGDEFAALVPLPEHGQTYLNGLISRVRSTVQRNVALLGKPDLGQMSIGSALFPEHADEYRTLFGCADSALYQAKDHGRNCTSVYDRAERQTGSLEPVELDVADRMNRLSAGFQPIIELASGRCAGLEVLARSKAGGGSETPAALSLMFRDHKLAPQATRRMLALAMSAVATLPEAVRPDLWVNLTKFDLLDVEFAFDLQNLLDSHGLGWEGIVVEVHEGVILSDRSGQTYHSLQEIRRRGGRVALDDFGKGYAGLTHIRDWPIDIIKIDRSFIASVDSDPHSRVVVEALVMITKSRSIDVVAEGIETEAQASTVRDLQCRYGQGFVFDAAIPLEQLAARLTRFQTRRTLPEPA